MVSNMRLNEVAEKVYFINLDRRPDRLAHVREQFAKNSIVANRFCAIDGKDIDLYPNLSRGAAGCLESQLSILRKCIADNVQSVAIFEDDVFFVDNFESKFSNFYSQVPSDWQFMYLANNKYQAKVERVAENVEKVSDAWSAHAFVVKRESMQIAVELADRGEFPIDVYYGIIQRHVPSYSATPALAGQRADHSDIEEIYIDYNWIYGL